MAIELDNLPTIIRACKKLTSKKKLLILGDANLFFTLDDLKSLAASEHYPLREIGSAKIDAVTLGQLLGFEQTDTLDINHKTTIHWDLHQPVPENLHGQFDCVIDAGVLFWCFDPAAAFKNVYRMTKQNGVIIHITSVIGFIGRGYYNIHPRTFDEFYASNSAKVLEFSTSVKRASIVTRLLRKLTGNRSRTWTIPGKIPYFVGSFNSGLLNFGDQINQTNKIPNDVVGTFSFQKLTAGEPAIPTQVT